jgi:hypothetical protein
MPFIWNMKPNLKFAPVPEYSQNFQQSVAVCKKHLEK